LVIIACFNVIITSAKEVMVFVIVYLSVCLLATLPKNCQTDLHEIFSRAGWQWANEQMIKFCNPDHRLDTGIVFRICHYWEKRKVLSTDCAAQHCSAGYALAGIAIATMTSLCHQPMTDSHDRHALVEV